MSEQSDGEVEQMAERIRTFAQDVENPDDWMIVVPVEEYGDVKDVLDTTKDLSTYYQEIPLCYGDGYDETQVRLKRSLSDHLEITEGVDPDGE
jgi:hypothetical protein